MEEPTAMAGAQAVCRDKALFELWRPTRGPPFATPAGLLRASCRRRRRARAAVNQNRRRRRLCLFAGGMTFGINEPKVCVRIAERVLFVSPRLQVAVVDLVVVEFFDDEGPGP